MIKQIRSTVLSDVRVGRIRTKTSGCACADDAKVKSILLELGLYKVANMHSRSQDKDYVETPNDWLLHAKEEDDKLFPMLMTISMSKKMVPEEKERLRLADYVMNLKKEHDMYIYPYVSKGELPPEEKMVEHAKKENYIIKKFQHQLLLLNGKNKTSVGKFYTTDVEHPFADVGGIDLTENASFSVSPVAKIMFGITVGGAALALGAPIFVAAIPLLVAGTSIALTKNQKPGFITSVNSLEVSIWESNTNIPSDKLNNRGQKFIDPYAIDGACWPEVDKTNVNTIMALPKDGRIRVEYMHKNAQATKPIVMPAADLLISTADAFGSKALEKVGDSLKDRQKWWADQISKYAKYTANGFVIAFAEVYAAFLKWMPASWNAEYKRAQSIAEGVADELKVSLISSIGFSIPYPMHILDSEIDGLDDLKLRTSIIDSNLKKTLVLPNSAKEILRSFFALLASLSSTDVDVQSAINYVDNSDWGRRNLASDEQVYLVGCVLAKATGQDVVSFTTELWNRSQGWNRFKGLLTNKHILYLKSGSGSMVSRGTTSNGGYVYEQSSNTGWNSRTETDEETGYTFASNCINNARQLNYLDIILTGFQIVSEKTGSESPINNKIIKINPISI